MLLAFEEAYVPRMWGGTRLRDVFDKPTPDDATIGEAWLVADHPRHVSVVKDGPLAGRTLHDLVDEMPDRILGQGAEPTVHGRFPLLLKLLDTGDKLSIQVHPDDSDARRLNEPDIGKTEMWYVLEGDTDSALYCGLPPEVDAESFEASRSSGDLAELLARIPARRETVVFVPAGTVHAIGGGCLLAEIQQNSDLTYRIDDWDRVQDDGSRRELHLEKALDCTHFGSRHMGSTTPLAYPADSGRVSVLAACRHFAAERLDVDGALTCETHCASFHLLLEIRNTVRIIAGSEDRLLRPGEALLVTGDTPSYRVEGDGALLRYYVPDLSRDIVRPLREAGHTAENIVALGGDRATSDLVGVVA